MNRAARFVWVGAGGFAVQGLTLHALTAAGLPYPLATAIAVEAAILHNFVWHERWTWRDRVTFRTAGLKACRHGTARRDRVARFVRFNGSTAVVSIGGNVVLMALFVEYCRLPLLPANLLAVLTLSVINFVSADRLVFATKLPRHSHNPTPM